MPEFKNIAALAVCLSGLMLALKPESTNLAVAFVSAAFLFAFTEWLKTKETKTNEKLEEQMKALRQKVDDIMVIKGFGR